MFLKIIHVLGMWCHDISEFKLFCESIILWGNSVRNAKVHAKKNVFFSRKQNNLYGNGGYDKNAGSY